MPAAETPTESAVLRRVLGRYLRGLRNQARLTTKVAARMLEWSEPKLWRIETGQTVLRSLDVEAMCTVYGAPADVTAALGGLARQARADGQWHPAVGLRLGISACTPSWRMRRGSCWVTRAARYRRCCGLAPTPAR